MISTVKRVEKLQAKMSHKECIRDLIYDRNSIQDNILKKAARVAKICATKSIDTINIYCKFP